MRALCTTLEVLFFFFPFFLSTTLRCDIEMLYACVRIYIYIFLFCSFLFLDIYIYMYISFVFFFLLRLSRVIGRKMYGGHVIYIYYTKYMVLCNNLPSLVQIWAKESRVLLICF